MDLLMNFLIFVITLVLTVLFFRKDGVWAFRNGVRAFRYFTVLSNVFCAAAALLMCLAPESGLVWTLKYIGTAAVTVTMLTVFLFLGPTMGYHDFLSGTELFMHLVTPLLAILSLCLLERRPLGLGTALLGVLPVLIYGAVYLYKVIYAPEARRWDDFYGFNRGGRWPVSYAAMLLGSFAVCMAYFVVLNK